MPAPSNGFESKRTALLVMDFQNGIVGRLPDADALVGRVRDAIADVRAHEGVIGYVRVAFTDDDYASVPATNARFAAAAESRALTDDDPSTAIVDALAPQDGDIVVRKVRIGAMSTTDLDQRLRARGVNTVVLAGVSTSGVVLSTVMDAADRDYRVYVLSDGVADTDTDVHEILLDKVFGRRGTVIDTAELHNMLEKAV
ncbi:cysteine hydrolase [Asanoa sp. WMMD1127]|uniref:cysteine hydrolase family protein n=1 Tax=Asanoa sp. WMMD1127 TaxID=3016107 RepID=UPI002417EBE1|nr:cysteine hydrolase [Asanoa sp. WMMD1127]MDG4826644.1 cysteine hydrolase [Asanoa sp. WMMD1127]